MGKDVGQTQMACQASLIAQPPSTAWPIWQFAYVVWCGFVLVVAMDASWSVLVPVAACFAYGLLLVGHGLRAMTRERALRAEWLRAQAEWESLRSGAAAATAQGQALDDYLRSAGYRVPGAVRAIAHHLSPECAAK
jgi:hypothetical protein